MDSSEFFKEVEANIVVALRLRPFLDKEKNHVRSIQAVIKSNQVILRTPHDVL